MNRIFYTILLCLITSVVRAELIYVDGTLGADCTSNDYSIANRACSGSDGDCYNTIQEAVNAAVSGDTVYVRGGTYQEDVDFVRSGSGLNSRIWVQSYSTERATVDGSPGGFGSYLIDDHGYDYLAWVNIDVRESDQVGLWIYGDYFYLSGCSIYNNGSWGSTGHTGTDFMSNNGVITGCTAYGNGWNGFSVGYAENGHFHHNWSYDNEHMGFNINQDVYSEGSYYTSGITVSYNRIYGNGSGIFTRCQKYMWIFNNVIYENVYGGIFFSDAGECTRPFDAYVYIYNNTVVDNGPGEAGGAQLINNTSRYVWLTNNIFSHADGTCYTMDINENANQTYDYNLYYSNIKIGWDGSTYNSLSAFNSATGQDGNGVEGDPIYVDRSGDDYSLDTGSNAIDAGTSSISDVVSDDITGKARPVNSVYDIGAYEFGTDENGNGSATSPSPPDHLLIDVSRLRSWLSGRSPRLQE